MTSHGPRTAGTGDLLGATLTTAPRLWHARLVVVAMSRDENPKATSWRSSRPEQPPVLAVKVALTPGAAVSVRGRGRGARRLAELDPGLVGGTFPASWTSDRTPRGAVLVTTVVPGVPMSVDYHRWRHTARPSAVREDLTDAAAWLDELARVPVRDVAVGNRSADARTQWTRPR